MYSLYIRRVETQKCTITRGKMTNWVGQDAGHGHGMESNFTNAFTHARTVMILLLLMRCPLGHSIG